MAAALLMFASVAIRLATLSRLQLAPDEAYYWEWSRRPALGYYDQGPLIAYLIRSTTTLFGTNLFGVRFGAVICCAGMLWCCWTLARRHGSPFGAFCTLSLLMASPLLNIGSLIITYDAPYVLFWALTILWLDRALFGPPEQQRRAWLACGLFCGLGFLSKHTMLLVVPCLLLFLALSPAHRFWLRRPEPYAAFGICMLLYIGPIVWNAQHHWWTFGHLLFLSNSHTRNTGLRQLTDFVASQALLMGPGLFVGTLMVSWKARRPHDLFLVVMGLPIFALFCLMCFKSKVQANWAPCAWITPAVLLGMSFDRRTLERFVACLLPSVLLTLLIIFPGLRMLVHLRLSAKNDPTAQTIGWKAVAARVEQVRQEMRQNGRLPFVAANAYQYSALMAFYLPDRPVTWDLYMQTRLSMYAAYVDGLKAHLGENAVYVDETLIAEPYLRQLFDRVEWAPPVVVWSRPLFREPVRTVYIARCYGLKRNIGLTWAHGG
jgi:4-amino-4-deoxy-L-arabinose transferase-like glycosyltransferase